MLPLAPWRARSIVILFAAFILGLVAFASTSADAKPWSGSGASGVTAPRHAVRIAPGKDRILRAIAKHPAGSVFRLRVGTHRLTKTAIPKRGQEFWAAQGGKVVVTEASGASVLSAFGGGAGKVTIAGLIVRGFGDGSGAGAISDMGSGWVIKRNVIGPNAGWGVRLGDRTLFKKNRVHHNAILGLAGGGRGSVVVGNEIAFNNPQDEHDWFYEAGGTKFVGTTGLEIRGNLSHGNGGPGLWTDINNRDTLYERNLSRGNDGPGIFHEISCNAVIRNNKVVRNARGQSDLWYGGAGILVSSSVNVEVRGNVVIGNGGGIGLMNRVPSGDPLPARCDRDLKNAYVHDNLIKMDRGVTGLVSNDDGDLPFASWNNRFRRNDYRLDDLGSYRFEWNGAHTRSGWRALGHDRSGTFKRI